ncbi:MAG: hypothetical protein DSZ05_02705 [Sulfurospirillum sp.]|nr:MAG: hypothetical protein DSZ05_02705 [Sulfurospirillum sp.]
MIDLKKSFLDNVSVAKKSFLLLLVTTFGLLFSGALVHFGLFSIKQEVNHIYSDNIAHIAIVHEIQSICNTDLKQPLHQYLSKTADKSHTIRNLQESAQKLNRAYTQLQTLSPEAAQSLAPLLKQFNTTFASVNHLPAQNDTKSVTQKILPKFDTIINDCNRICDNIITDKLDTVASIKTKIDEHYYGTLISTILFIVIILLLSAILARSVYTNLRRLIFGLSDIVAKKTRDYQELARQLEYKVNKEVIKNREKDQIMYQHARLAAMGEMIGNIAHQWRQPLNALTVLIQSFSIKNMNGTLTQEFIDQQVEEGLRLANQMSNTIEDFKNFFSPHKEREYFGVVHALKETLDLVEFFCKDEHIDIRLIAKEEIRVYGYSNEFSQVILNLLNNARDNFKHKNMQKDRKIIISVEKRNHPEPVVLISFVDNGGGIDEHIIDRIFEPYFTTKHKSTGTGIGLYMSKQIIEKQMHGLMTVKNITATMGTNTTYRCAQFMIAIPLK